MADLVRIGNIVLNMDTVLKFSVNEGRIDVELPGTDGGYLNMLAFTGDNATALRRWLDQHSVNITGESDEARGFADYRINGGPLLFYAWQRIYRLHKQHIDSGRISPYEGELRL